ncbi:hypothetical protein F4604DRAFT_1664193 [Suillus subluteus]|nr:hypothetical protein F4604DRAFT_1664193 [Suillus subluteus]
MHSHSLKDDIVCPGIPINWPEDLHSFYMCFPWARYNDGPDGLPFTIDITVPRLPRARSKLCTHVTIWELYPCEECGEIYAHIYCLVDITRSPKAHTNYQYLGLAHMRDTVTKHANQVNQLKLQTCNDSRRYMYALTQLDDYNRLLMAISENDIPRIHQVINKLEDALEGAYRLVQP